MMTKMVAAALAAVCVLATAAAEDADDERQAVRVATERFYAALNAMFAGDSEPMNDVWSHADDVTYMGPTGGIQVGWEQVLKQWSAQAAMQLKGRVKPGPIHLFVGHDVAVAQCDLVGENFRDGVRYEVSIRATHVFRKEQRRWKMVGHHADLLPFLRE